MTRDEIERFVRDALFGRVVDEAAIRKIVDRWWDTLLRTYVRGAVADPFQTKTDPPTFDEYLRTLSDADRWAHCANHAPHHAHTHTIVFNEGPYPDQVCVGTPHGLRYGGVGGPGPRVPDEIERGEPTW